MDYFCKPKIRSAFFYLCKVAHFVGLFTVLVDAKSKVGYESHITTSLNKSSRACVKQTSVADPGFLERQE